MRLTKSPSIIIILFLTLIIYSNTLHSPFHFDDYKVIAGNEGIKNIKDFRSIFLSNASRPVLTFSFALNFWWGRLDPFSYHLVNLLLHGINGVLLFLIFYLIFPINPLIPLLSSLVFVSHPVNTESVTYISSRSGVLCTSFYLLSVFFFIRFLKNLKSHSLKGWLSKPVIQYLLSILFFLLSAGTKETGITLPLFLILYEYCFPAADDRGGFLTPPAGQPACRQAGNIKPVKINRVSVVRYKLYYIPFFAIIGLIAVGRRYFFGTFGNPAFHRDYYQNFLTQGRALWVYMKLLFLPVNLNIDHEFFLSRSFWEFKTFVSFTGIIVLFLVAYKVFRKMSGISFCIFSFFLTMGPTSLIPLQDIISERWLYLPGVGFCLFLALFLNFLLHQSMSDGRQALINGEKKREEANKLSYPIAGDGRVRGINISVKIIGILLLLFFSILTFSRNSVWNSEISLWRDAARKSPGKARVYNNLGVALAKIKMYDEAIDSFRTAMRIDPRYSPSISNLGKAYREKGEKELMLEASLALFECGEYYTKKGMFKEAIISYKELIKLVPESIAAYGNLGIIYMLLNEKETAREYFKKVLNYDPKNEAAMKFLEEIDGNKK